MWQSGTQRMCCQVNLGVSECMNVAVWYIENVMPLACYHLKQDKANTKRTSNYLP